MKRASTSPCCTPRCQSWRADSQDRPQGLLGLAPVGVFSALASVGVSVLLEVEEEEVLVVLEGMLGQVGRGWRWVPPKQATSASMSQVLEKTARLEQSVKEHETTRSRLEHENKILRAALQHVMPGVELQDLESPHLDTPGGLAWQQRRGAACHPPAAAPSGQPVNEVHMHITKDGTIASGSQERGSYGDTDDEDLGLSAHAKAAIEVCLARGMNCCLLSALGLAQCRVEFCWRFSFLRQPVWGIMGFLATLLDSSCQVANWSSGQRELPAGDAQLDRRVRPTRSRPSASCRTRRCRVARPNGPHAPAAGTRDGEVDHYRDRKSGNGDPVFVRGRERRVVIRKDQVPPRQRAASLHHTEGGTLVVQQANTHALVQGEQTRAAATRVERTSSESRISSHGFRHAGVYVAGARTQHRVPLHQITPDVLPPPLCPSNIDSLRRSLVWRANNVPVLYFYGMRRASLRLDPNCNLFQQPPQSARRADLESQSASRTRQVMYLLEWVLMSTPFSQSVWPALWVGRGAGGTATAVYVCFLLPCSHY